MKRLLLTLCLTTALHAQQPAAAPHTFTSTDGRKLTATVIEKTATTVTLRRAEDGKDFILPLERLSAADQALVKAWGTKPVPLVMADPALPESWVVPPKYVSAFEFARLPGTAGPMFTTFKKDNPSRLTTNERIGLIRSDGLVLCEPDKDESLPPFFLWASGFASIKITSNYFRDHRVLPKLSGGKYGLVDVDGQQVVPPQWDSVGPFSQGLFTCSVAEKYGYANLKGEMVISPQWVEARPFSGGYAVVRASKEGKLSVIDKTGKIISDAVWDEVSQIRAFGSTDFPDHLSAFDYKPPGFVAGLFWVALNKKWGLYDFAKNVPMGELQWDKASGSAHVFRDGRAWVLRDGKYGMIGLTGKVVLEPAWEGHWVGKDPYRHHYPPTRVGNCIQAESHVKTPCYHLDGTPALTDDVYGDSVYHYDGYFQLKIESGKLIRVEKNFRDQEPTRMVLRRSGRKNAVGPMVGLADLDGKLLGEVQASWIHATPSPDYFKLLYHDPRCGLIDATGKEVEPVAQVENLPLDTLQISDLKSLPDGEIIAAFRGTSDTATPDSLFIKTAKGLVKVPWKAPDATIQEAPGTVTVKPHQKDGKWGYIRLIEAKP